MKNIYCTLYNSLYIDKGLVMYDSLRECTKEFKLYVLCMDDKCYEILCNLKQPDHIPIRLSDFENNNNDLLRAKQNRSFGEYCWTCTSSLIRFVLNYYSEKICTYLDADMYFYHDPQILIDEMLSAGKSVMMVPHRFTKRNQHLAKKVGTYCVEFNCFKNDAAGREVLNHWYNKCLECCSNIGDGIHWGDQKYMDEWPVIFPDKVHICKNQGAGLAPWNIELYKSFDNRDDSAEYIPQKVRIPLLFFHFQNLKYIAKNKISTNISKDIGADGLLIMDLYRDYLMKINTKKNLISNKYGINSLLTIHPSDVSVWWKRIMKSMKIVRLLKCAIDGYNNTYIVKL